MGDLAGGRQQGWGITVSAQRCIHELLTDQCSYCRPKSTAATRYCPSCDEYPHHQPGRGCRMPEFHHHEPDPRGPWFMAEYEGQCADCGRDIERGDQIRADGHGGYLCGGCGA